MNQVLTAEIVRCQLKERCANTTLGILWILLHPFISFVILYTVFTQIRGMTGDRAYFGAKLIMAIFVFSFIREGIINGSMAIVKNGNLIGKIKIEKLVLINASMFLALFNFVVPLLLAFSFFSYIGLLNYTWQSITYFIYIILVGTVLVYGVCLLMNIVTVIMRDAIPTMQLIFVGLFWVSGVFYDIAQLKGTLRMIVYSNPVAIILDSVKGALVMGEIRNVELMVFWGLFSLVLMLIARLVFRKSADYLVDYL